MNFQREQFAAILPELKPLLQLHWEEVAFYKDIPLDPDYDTYIAVENIGKLRVFTVREQGELIGYAIFFIGHMHYKSTPIATQDVIFLHPDHRGRGARLILYCDFQLASEGIQVVMHHTKMAPGLDFSPILKRLGYEETDRVLARRLDNGC